MARPVDPQSQYRVKLHSYNGYTYASTQPSYLDPETGKKKYRYIHWGAVDEKLKFTPGNSFWLASPEERAMLIFPEDWDVSQAFKFVGLRHPGRPACDGQCQNRMYGDVWLLEQVAMKTGIRQDLDAVFDGNSEVVDDLLTLAMFPYLTGHTYNRVVRWQRNAKTPSSRELTPTVITRLTQAITERHRLELLKLRAGRVGKGELCAVDSTTRSAYGDKLSDIRWGKNKERLPLEQTTEVVVYSLSNHIPLYYRTFPGNIPDSRTFRIIFADLDHTWFKNLVLVTDRGYETLFNLEKYILRGQPMVMCAKTCQKDIVKVINGLGESGGIPMGMEIDPDEKLYFKQFDFDYQVKSTGTSIKVSDRLKLNLYFDAKRKIENRVELDIAKLQQLT
jgi:hypothetical protein